MTFLTTRRPDIRRALATLGLMAAAAMMAPTASNAQAAGALQAGTLVCKGDGGWGAIITSKKTFDCTFGGIKGTLPGRYTGTIRKFGLDLGVTGDTTLAWLVLGPSAIVGENYKAGSLAGTYAGAGVEATAGFGVGANALVGGSSESFALQPMSVQVQTGLSIAAAVQTLELVYVGPLQ